MIRTKFSEKETQRMCVENEIIHEIQAMNNGKTEIFTTDYLRSLPEKELLALTHPLNRNEYRRRLQIN